MTTVTHRIYFEEPGYIRLVYEGDAKLTDLKEVLTRGVALAVEKKCFRVLSDFRGMSLKISITQLYWIEEIQQELSRELDVPFHYFKRVVVVPAREYPRYKFFETVAVNRMHRIKVFTDYKQALEWLFDSEVPGVATTCNRLQ